MALSGCAEKTQIELFESTAENEKSEIEISASEPIIYSAKDILEDDTSETVRDYYSVYAMDYIRETIPQNPDAENSDDGYVADNIIYYKNVKEILRTPVYMQAEPARVDDVSLARVQWLDGETAMIDGRLLYNTETDEKYEFNADWENVLNYALNKTKDRLAVSFVNEGIYR